MDTSFPTCVVITNMPKVDEVKKPKLTSMMQNKILGPIGEVLKLEIPMKDGLSLGFALVEWATKESAAQAVEKVNNHRLDASHTFRCFAYSDLTKLESLPETFEAPPLPPFNAPPDLGWWLSDPATRDQFLTRHAAAGREETQVAWAELGRPPAAHYGGEREKAQGLACWCDREARWSPKGSYLITFHLRGVALWGGPGVDKLRRIAHDGVNKMTFSPCERFLLTCNFRGHPRDGDSTVKFWDVRDTRQELRAFKLGFSAKAAENAEVRFVPNLFKWSADGNFVAHLTYSPELDREKRADRRPSNMPPANCIKIYAVPSMQLLDKKSLATAGVMDFAWSPTDNTLAYWCAEEGNTPARVCLLAIPTRKDLRQKNLFNLSDCQLTWAPNGDFLSAKVVRHTKSKKTLMYNIELFRAREAGVPVETLDVAAPVLSIAWEPGVGRTRFGLVTSDGGKPSVSFYDMGKPPDAASSAALQKVAKAKGSGLGVTAAAEKKPECTHLKTLTNRTVSNLLWSPAGGHCVLAGLQGVADYSGSFEFYDVEALPARGVETEHHRANAVEWDPSGRMLMTAVTQPREGQVYKFQIDNGYKLWTFQGENFVAKPHEKFYSFAWRPRPPSLLDQAATKAVIKNLRKFERKFERADKLIKRKRELKLMVKKQEERAALRERLARNRARNYEATQEARVAARYGVDVDADDYFVVSNRTREVILSTKEEVYGMV